MNTAHTDLTTTTENVDDTLLSIMRELGDWDGDEPTVTEEDFDGDIDALLADSLDLSPAALPELDDDALEMEINRVEAEKAVYDASETEIATDLILAHDAISDDDAELVAELAGIKKADAAKPKREAKPKAEKKAKPAPKELRLMAEEGENSAALAYYNSQKLVAPVKVKMKSDNIVDWATRGDKLSVFIEIAVKFALNHVDGFTNTQLRDHFADMKANGVKGYALSTANPQSQNIPQTMELLGMIRREGGVNKINPGSTLIQLAMAKYLLK